MKKKWRIKITTKMVKYIYDYLFPWWSRHMVRHNESEHIGISLNIQYVTQQKRNKNLTKLSSRNNPHKTN